MNLRFPSPSNSALALDCRLLFEAAADAIFLMEDVRFVACNPSALALFGCGREDILGRTPWEFSPLRQADGGESETAARAHIALAIDGQPQLIEWRHQRLDGGLFDAEIRLNRIDLPEGPLLQAVVRDITARRQAEEGLRLFQRIVADSTDHISVLDRDYVYRVVNKTYLDTHDRREEEIVGHSVAELFGQAAFEALIKDKLDRCLAGEVVNYQAWFEFQARGRRYMNVTYTPYRDNGGQVGGAIVNARDITELRLAEEALADSEARNRAILDTAVDGILVVDEASRVAYANPATCELTGHGCEELQGRPLTDLMPEHFRDRHDTAFASYLQTGQPRMPWRELAFVLLHRDGHEIPVEVSIGERSGAGQRQFIGILRDVTERRRTETSLRKSRERYKSLFENMLGGYAYCRMAYEEGKPSDFVYLDVNSAFERLTGLRDVRGKRVSEVIPGIHRDNPELLEIYGRVARSGQSERFDTYLPALHIWLDVSVYRPEADHFVAVFDNVTQRKLALQALREREERIKLLLDSMAEGIYGVDTRGDCTFVNPAGLRLLGYERSEELLGRHIHELIHHSHADGSPYPARECRAYRAYIEDRGIHVDEEVFWRRDGTAFPVEYWSYPMRQGGQVIGSVVTFLDIGERRRSEERLYATRQTLQHVINTVPHFVFWKDRDSRYLGCNAAFARLGNMESSEGLIGKSDYELTWRRHADQYRHDDLQVMETQTPKHNIIEPLALEDGRTAWLETSKVPLRDSHGQVIGVLGVFQDITARRLAEERLRQSAKVFDSTTDGVMITDAQAKIIAVNRAFTEITGYPEAEVLGRNPRLLNSGRHAESFYQAMWKSIGLKGSWSGELWNRSKNGEIYPEWLTISSVTDDAGKVTNYVGVFADISQIKQSEAKLEHLAHYDPLTDLPNRLLFGARLDHALQRAERDGTLLALLFIDLDRFKTVNDGLGHPVGDRLLQEVAQRLSHCVRAEDTVARLGGDEFVIVLEGLETTLPATTMADKLLAALTRPFELDGQELFIGASIGISAYPADGGDATTLLKNADAAMYRSKEDGRNTYRFYNAEMTRSARERLILEANLRQAIAQQEFVLHYQPQVDVASGGIVGVEALVRWDHPVSGLISPVHFIPLAEETGLIIPLGEWVLFAACAQAKAWNEQAGRPSLAMAVNLSPRQFRQEKLAEHVRAVLDATGLPPALLELEITESALMENADRAIVTLRALKELGIRISMDDFGTGYSSLAQLKRFPIDKLKIDQSFMRGIPRDRNDIEIAATIIAMARNLRLKVLAEGVETEDQLAFLQIHACDAYQGYLRSRPLPARELEAWLAAAENA